MSRMVKLLSLMRANDGIYLKVLLTEKIYDIACWYLWRNGEYYENFKI